MFVMTMTKRKLIRAVMFVLVLITGIAIGVFAILSSIDTGAENVKLPIYNVKRTDNKISITFDCAWGNSNTDKLISRQASAYQGYERKRPHSRYEGMLTQDKDDNGQCPHALPCALRRI